MPAPSAAPVLRPPPWATPIARASQGRIDLIDAAFAAGAALALLDAAKRRNAPFAGAWRQRLALHAAAASLEGRAGDETSLRDALALTRPGADPGPAGRVYLAWRLLASSGARKFPEIALGLGAAPADLAGVSNVFETHARSAAAAVMAALPRARPLAFAVADGVLAARLGWRMPLPLLAPDASRARPGESSWPAECCAAYARAAASACDLHAELARQTARLESVAPKLRAKGAKAAIAALLDDDAVSGATQVANMSDRGLRRLFDRLVELGAVRELTGRSSFRLYGL